MEEKVSQLIEALTEHIRKMDGQSVGEQSKNPGILRHAFDKTDAQKDEESNKNLAELNAEENAKARQKEEESKSRKIVKSVMPMSVVGFDEKALKQLSGITPAIKEAKEKVEKPEQEGEIRVKRE